MISSSIYYNRKESLACESLACEIKESQRLQRFDLKLNAILISASLNKPVELNCACAFVSSEHGVALRKENAGYVAISL